MFDDRFVNHRLRVDFDLDNRLVLGERLALDLDGRLGAIHRHRCRLHLDDGFVIQGAFRRDDGLGLDQRRKDRGLVKGVDRRRLRPRLGAQTLG